MLNPYRHAVGGLELVFFDDFTNWTGDSFPDDAPVGWGKNGTYNTKNFLEENANGMRFVEDLDRDGGGTGISIRSPTYGEVGSDLKVTVNIYSSVNGSMNVADGGLLVGWTHVASGLYTADYTGVWGFIDIKRNWDPDMIIRSILIEKYPT